MNRTNIEIKNQFEFFSELLSDLKIVPHKEIQLLPKMNNVYWLIGYSSLRHENITDDISLIVERSKRDSKYGFKLKCKTLTNEPFFRFDSDGPAHRNNNPTIPLEEQSVSTPHFNTYDANGKPIAYKNDVLKRPEDSNVIVSDINFGASLFCMEANCKLEKSDEFPVIIDQAPEIAFKDAFTINFDNITFE